MSVVTQINYAPDRANQKWTAEKARDAALQLAGLSVLNWELAIQSETEGTFGGIYLFETEAAAHEWGAQAKSLLARIGATHVLTQALFADEVEGEATPAERPALLSHEGD